MTRVFKRSASRRDPIKMRSQSASPWGRVAQAFNDVIDHIHATPDASILLAAGTAQTYVNMHSACEHYLPMAGGWRVAGVWFFPNKSRVRISRIADMEDAAQVSSRRFTLIAVHAEAEVIAVLQPLLTTQGRIIPFMGAR